MPEGDRPVWFVHGARDGAHHPLAREVRALATRDPRIRHHVAYSRPRAEDRRGVDYDSEGRLDGALLARLVDEPEARYFLCGPVAFMAEIQTQLEGHGVNPDHIQTESFGPVG
jgi:ferredoxin-NADP reductase